MPLHKGAQKRIYFEGAVYFVTCVTQARIEYFKELIFCELFIEMLKFAKKIRKFNLYAFVVLLDHFHLLFQPQKAEDLPKIMHFVKRNISRNINFILGYENKEAIYKSLLQLGEEYKIYKVFIEEHYKFLLELKKQFILKYGENQSVFPKFQWQKSYRDHYIRNNEDFQEHLTYIYNNPVKHEIPDSEKYQYIFTNYPELIDEF